MIRVEDKYDITSSDIYSISSRLSAAMDYDASASDGKYLISSIYFDDLWDTHYHDTISGNPIRKKYRIRIYNNSFDTIKLEVKNKIYSRIDKKSSTITREEMYQLINGEPIRDYESSINDSAICEFNQRIISNHLMPKVIVTYERQAFTCEAGNVRITFDTGIRGSTDIASFGNPALISDVAEIDKIMEVKYDEFIPSYILQLLETNSMYQLSCSKYRLCREITNI